MRENIGSIKESCFQKHFLNQIKKSKLSDLELISIALTAEYVSIDSKYQLFRKPPSALSSKVERSVFFKKRRLFPFIENIRLNLAEKLTPFEAYLIVDSMPVDVCKLSRASRSKICKDSFEVSPDKGFCASQKMHYYSFIPFLQ